MALVEANLPLNMLDNRVFYGALTEASSTTIEITSGDKVARYTGSFTYDAAGNVFGQLKGYQVLLSGSVAASVTAFTVDAHDFIEMLSAEDVDGIYELVLRHGDRFDGSSGRDLLKGFNGADRMEGNGGRDDLFGGKGNDVLDAGAGRDKLIGGAGADRLIGGTDGGRDTFIFEAWTDSRMGAQDTIENFSRHADRIDLLGIDADAATGANEAFLWAGKTAAAHSVWWGDSGKGAVLKADVNGDGAADVQILLAGIHSIGEGDLLL